jgi:alpha-glucosidase
MTGWRFRGREWCIVWLIVTGCNSGGTSQVQANLIQSPDGALVLAVASDQEGRLSYTVVRNGDVVVGTSPLGLTSSTHDLTRGVRMSSSSARVVAETYVLPTGKRSERRVAGNEVRVPLQDANGARAELVMRAHEDGVAFRYRLLGEGESEVTSESTGFAMPEDSRLLTRVYDGGEILFVPTAGAYEQPPEIVPIGQPTETTGYTFPTLFASPDDPPLYLMVTEADLGRSYCASRLDEMPEGNLYTVRFPDEREGKGVGEVLPSSQLPFETPWRVITIGDLATVVESTLVDDLSAASVVADESWIAPGRSAWSWFSQETGTPELQSEYIDFAGEYGWDYVLIDAKWDQWDDAEQTVQDLVAEAEAVGVRLLLWYNSGGPHTIAPLETPTDLMLEPTRRPEMEKISGWGIAGIKVDFFNSDKQDRIHQYLGILEDAADFELLVNFHGATVPRGWQRTYPHLMTHEAVNGAEVYKFASVQDPPDALTNLHHALLRNVVGSMDYTPVVFEAALTTAGLPYAHSLALSVVFESGIQHFADRADSNTEEGYRAVFGAFPFVGAFMSTVPVAWDDTRLVTGSIDDHVILARRKGDVWYLGGIHVSDASLDYTFELDFLEPGTSYDMAWIEQGEDPASLTERATTVAAGDSVTVTLQADGGFVAALTPQ